MSAIASELKVITTLPFPQNCSQVVMGQATTLSCPKTNYIYKTSDFMRGNYTNYLTAQSNFSLPSLSQETTNPGAIILLRNSFELWRIKEVNAGLQLQFIYNLP